ncbi:heme-dependent oxidative N-demethylase family protein [Shimia sagamensis]|uniref:DUF3445 domain-containing protein n=1 Tax=Shimia sagamensis TaxID=1566352 RepID=A0ABY1PL04_9RHOB|nr:DUF3445 domain-containing protein [Shimia sagamensis]SMP35104.1 Protein of unknown function [Shimia sagamensis]
MTEVLQSSIPYDALKKHPLPGIAPLTVADWLIVDEAYRGQMSMRFSLLSGKPDLVLACDPGALLAAQEVLQLVLDHLRKRTDFRINNDEVMCPDGRNVTVDWAQPLLTAGQIIQEDICLLQKVGDEHVLTGAVLCFPASWTLAEKFMRPLTGIHVPVSEYDANIAKRVQRLFDGVRVGQPLWRKNALWYDTPELFTPRVEAAPREPVPAKSGPYLRSERQCILRLPNTDAVVFSIHTFMVRREDILDAPAEV